MKKNISNPTKKFFALLAIPAIAILLMAFSEKEYVVVKDRPLIIVDGKEIQSMDSIVTDEIHSITVRKDADFIDLYGEKAKNGVILITTKTFAEHNPNLVLQETQTEQQKIFLEQQKVMLEQQKVEKMNDEVEKDRHLLSNLKDGSSDKSLIIVDDKEVSGIENLSAADINSVTVLKGNVATSIYGEKGKNGVILITTKTSHGVASSLPR